MPEFSMKVPSCPECNKGKGDGSERDMCNDEEHVRTLFAAAGQNHPTATRLIEKEITRSFERNASLRNRFLEKMVTVNALTPSGVIVPDISALQINDDDRAKIQRVITKMVKGLHYTMSEVTWPDPCPLPVDWRVAVEYLDAKKYMELNQRFDHCPRNSKWTDMGSEQAIRFRGVSEARDSHRTAWLLLFYEVVPFFAYTEPPEK
jgi:hypothetical protein